MILTKTLSLVVVMLCIHGDLYSGDAWSMTRVGVSDYGVNWSMSRATVDGWKWFASDNGTVVKMSGAADSLVRIEVGTCSDLRSLEFVGSHIVAGAADGEIYTSTDNSDTWHRVAIVPGEIMAIQPLSDSALAVCTRNGIVSIVDLRDGENTIIFSDPASSFTDMDHHYDELTVVGMSGLIMHTSNMGATWERTQHDSTHDFARCFRYDDSTLVIGAFLTRTFISSDNGRTFDNMYQIKSYPTLLNVTGVDPVTSIARHQNRLFVTGTFTRLDGMEYENVYHSDDRGLTWDSVPFPAEIYETAVVEPTALFWDADGVGVLVMANRDVGVVHICSSSDNGVNWQSDSVLLGYGSELEPFEGRTWIKSHSLVDVDTSKGKLIALSRRDLESRMVDYATTLLGSDNQGQEWDEIASLPSNIKSMATHGSMIMLGCDSGAVLLSADQGASFSDRIIIDSVVAWNQIEVNGATRDGQFVVYSNMQKSRDSGVRQGWVYTVDADQKVRAIPFERTNDNDYLTSPFVRSSTVLSMYHEVDTNRRVTTSHLIEWDVRTDQIVMTDVTNLIRDVVVFGSEVEYATDPLVWITVNDRMFVFDRVAAVGSYLDEMADGSQYRKHGMTRHLIVDHNAIIAIRRFAVMAKNTLAPMWNIASRCGSTTNVYYQPTDIVNIGEGRYFVTGMPCNYVLTVPAATAVREDDISANAQPTERLIVERGSTLVLSGTESGPVWCFDVTGASLPIVTHQTSDTTVIETNGLLPGLYLLSIGSNTSQVTRTMLISP